MFLGVSLAFLIVLPCLPVFLTGDGTPAGHIRLYMMYSLNLIIFFLSLIVIFQSSNALYEEIEQRHMYLLVTKPVPRWKIVVGHWAGMTAVAALLLAAAIILNLAGMKWIRERFDAVITPQQWQAIRAELFSARRSARPPEPDIQSAVHSEIARIRTENPSEKVDYKRVEKSVSQREFFKHNCVSARFKKVWEINGIRAVKGDSFQFKFTFFCSDIPKDGTARIRWIFGSPDTGQQIERIGDYSPGVAHTLHVPISVIGRQGDVSVTCINFDDEYLTLIFPSDNGIEILYSSGAYWINYAKGAVLILVQLAVLCGIGVFFSSFLSFPVACLMTLFVFGAGSHAGYLSDMLSRRGELPRFLESFVENPPETAVSVINKAAAAFVNCLPHFDRINPVLHIIDGRYIEWETLLFAGAVVIGIQLAAVLAIGGVFLAKKEIARVTV